jgi:hypothetical protein
MAEKKVLPQFEPCRKCIANINLAAGEGLSYHQTDRITDQGAPVSSFPSSADPPAPILEEDDLVLIRRITAKDHQAFETLYYRYAPRLGRYLMRLLKKRELVEEVINDVMLVAWQNAACFDPTIAHLSHWLFGIAHKRRSRRLRKPQGKLNYCETIQPEANRTSLLMIRLPRMTRRGQRCIMISAACLPGRLRPCRPNTGPWSN